jgi:hypothetical protein
MILLAVLYFVFGFLACAALMYWLGHLFVAAFIRHFTERHREIMIATLEYAARTPTALAKVAAELGDAHGIDDALRATARAMRKEGQRR